MDMMINTNGLICCGCGGELDILNVIKADRAGRCYCRSCCDESESSYTYINAHNGSALLVLDDDTLAAVRKDLTYGGCESIREFDGTMDMINTENNAVLIIETADKESRPSPQQKLINDCDDLYRQARLVMNSSVKVMSRRSRNSDRTYIIYKSDSRDQMLDSLNLIAAELRKIKASGGARRVYMQKSSFDTDDAARLMLADSGFECVYCSGAEKTAPDKELFKIDFTFDEFADYLGSRIIGQGKELIKAAYLVYDYITNAARGITTNAVNWMLTAPSGMGKTEFFRAVRDFFDEHFIPVPVIQYDLSQLTETGYKGDDAKVILKHIHEFSPASIPCGTAICFLDEADKKLTPSFDSRGNDINAAAQAALLTMVEGTVMTAPDSNADVDTSKTMFVFMGAFQKLRDDKQKEGELDRKLFGGRYECPTEDECFFGDILLDDMITEGMMEELAGRLTLTVNFHKLAPEDMRDIIISRGDKIASERGVRIELTPAAVDEFAQRGYTNLGVRAPLNKLTELIFEAVSQRIRGGSYDPQRDVIVIDSADSAHISPRKKVAAADI